MASSKRREIMLFGIGILAGLVAVYGSLSAVGVAVASFAPERMPAPAISSIVHIDEKLRFIRQNPGIEPAVLAVGSSITWRQLSGAEFKNVAGGPDRFLNGGTAHLQIHQTRAMSKFLLAHYPSVKTLLVLLSVPDFEDCRTQPDMLFSPQDAARYAFDGWPSAYFYLHYVSPMRYFRGAMTLAERRAPMTGDLYLDAYGSGPLEVPEKTHGLRYGEIGVDRACVDDLDRFIREIDERGIQMLLVFSPVHPEYRTLYPEAMKRLSDVVRHVRAEVRSGGLNTGILDLSRDPTFVKADFFDAFHLEWPAAQLLSNDIAAAMEKRIAHRVNRAVPLTMEPEARKIRFGSTGNFQ